MWVHVNCNINSIVEFQCHFCPSTINEEIAHNVSCCNCRASWNMFNKRFQHHTTTSTFQLEWILRAHAAESSQSSTSTHWLFSLADPVQQNILFSVASTLFVESQVFFNFSILSTPTLMTMCRQPYGHRAAAFACKWSFCLQVQLLPSNLQRVQPFTHKHVRLHTWTHLNATYVQDAHAHLPMHHEFMLNVAEVSMYGFIGFIVSRLSQ